ncbi:MAG TPA: tRNA preQ1(34) S-adenosylmethionine ribosyltransferase-isomerase QueA [Anaerolineales bacterium]|nr:tRNA preQ1(34) S-adenosylmethionine ribosyltransferase-isomerase QueA [Anaerolineales bacterium]
MRTDDFDYDLPPERIAQRPLRPRDHSRLMILNRSSESIGHARFDDLPTLLRSGDVLVLNETRVIPARLKARKLPGGGRVEVLLLKRLEERTWEALVGGKRLDVGRRLQIEGGPLAEIEADLGGSRRRIRFAAPISPEIERLGAMPVPPYIKAPLAEPDEYQTVYARLPGSAAAPTAGLHFTEGLMDRLQAAGIGMARVVLHIGLDTFAPVDVEDPRQHIIHSEWCQVTRAAAEQLRRARQAGGRVVAVGTTAVRTLESAARASGGELAAFEGQTDLFILPGFTFSAVDAMITNFHLPRSTLLMLVSAFAGRERILRAYDTAIREAYRFYSFGDAMLIE